MKIIVTNPQNDRRLLWLNAFSLTLGSPYDDYPLYWQSVLRSNCYARDYCCSQALHCESIRVYIISSLQMLYYYLIAARISLCTPTNQNASQRPRDLLQPIRRPDPTTWPERMMIGPVCWSAVCILRLLARAAHSAWVPEKEWYLLLPWPMVLLNGSDGG